MKYIDVMGQPCPIPVIKAKKELEKKDAKGVIVTVDNIVAVQNLEKMAKGLHYTISHIQKVPDCYEVTILVPDRIHDNTMDVDNKTDGNKIAVDIESDENIIHKKDDTQAKKLWVVVIGKDTMGDGERELGLILLKGFIFSLTALLTPPDSILFLNSGAYLTARDSNVIEDLIKLEEKGTTILTCGTCSNYYNLQDKLAVGEITDMYGITERMALADSVVNL